MMSVALVVPCLAWLVAGPSYAHAGAPDGAVEVVYLTRVSLGEQPRLRLRARHPIGKLEVRLLRNDGKSVSQSFSLLPEGTTVQVPLPAEPGTFRYTGTLIIRNGGVTHENSMTFETVVAAPLEIHIDRTTVDLRARTLAVSSSRAPKAVAIALFSLEGTQIGQVQHDVQGKPARQPLTIGWPAPARDVDVARIDIKVTDMDGYFAGVSLFPWSVHIPHEEVGFATDSAAITPSERPKLDESLHRIGEALRRYKDLGPIKLFIAGHTDTQGAAVYNLKLSLQRARAIAGYFRQNGLKIPIHYEGFGEHAPLVATADDTDEARNRRVDYILAVEPPRLQATQFSAQWKVLP